MPSDLTFNNSKTDIVSAIESLETATTAITTAVTALDTQLKTQLEVLNELRIIRAHLYQITNQNITDEDINYDH